MINKLIEKIKELIKLVSQIEKLFIKVISLAGWILILIEMFR